MRILFMGTPDIAAECLKALYAAAVSYTHLTLPTT